MRKVIVYTPHAGGVAICHPAADCIRAMSCGGYWFSYPRGYLKTQLERQIEAGHDADAARRFVMAMQFGGCTEAEALAIIRDRDCAHRGTGCELWDISDVPADRTYRNAWRRSPNGGPIWIDERVAMEMDEAKAWQAYEAMRRGHT